MMPRVAHVGVELQLADTTGTAGDDPADLSLQSSVAASTDLTCSTADSNASSESFQLDSACRITSNG